jgi:S-adenosylmethionine decarboxylase
MTSQRPLGWHWLADLYDCKRLPTDPGVLEEILVTAAKLAKATVVQSCFHRFSPWGLSGVVVIAESHLAAHTWPERDAMCLDLFSCSESIQAKTAIDYVAEQVGATEVRTRCELRGAFS